MSAEQISFVNKYGDTIKGYAWTIDKPKANVVIVTGMEEYAFRYDDFAKFLNKNGYDVYCMDQYGQGLNAPTLDDLGIAPSNAFTKAVNNIDYVVTSCRVSLLPTYIFGHSMGSFMLQDYIQRFTSHVNKVVICGTNGPNAKMTYIFGKILTKLTTTKKNRNTKAKLMAKLAFGSYAKSIKNAQTSFDWLSVNEENVQKYIADPYCGYGSSKGFFYEFMKGNSRLYKNKFLKKIRKDMNILLIAGDADPVGAKGKGPTKLAKLYSKLGIENVQLKLYPGLRHEILNETERDMVYADILKFLDEPCSPAESFIK